MQGSESLFQIYALLEHDYAILTYIFCSFLLCAVAQSGGAWHKTPALNTPLDVHVLMVSAY